MLARAGGAFVGAAWFNVLQKNSTGPLLKKNGGGESCGPQLSTAPIFLSNGSVEFFISQFCLSAPSNAPSARANIRFRVVPGLY